MKWDETVDAEVVFPASKWDWAMDRYGLEPDASIHAYLDLRWWGDDDKEIDMFEIEGVEIIAATEEEDIDIELGDEGAEQFENIIDGYMSDKYPRDLGIEPEGCHE